MAQQQGKCAKMCAKCPIVMRITNIISALLLVGFGIAGLVLMTVNSLSSGKFFLLFSPIFMILVGLLFIAAQFSVECIMKHFTMLKSYFGRGIFNLFMSSTVFYYFSCGNNNEVVGWIAAILIFLMGLLYIFIHFCGGKHFNKSESEAEAQDTTRSGIKQDLKS